MLTALTIAGSDPSGGAGIQADLKTFHQFNVFGTSVLTLLTAQNTVGVRSVHCLEPSFVLEQLEAVLDDVPPAAIKTGALGRAAIVNAVGERLAETGQPLVVDPVMISKHGHRLVEHEVIDAYRDTLLERATLITPNLYEAEALTGCSIASVEDMEEAARRLAQLGAHAVVIKGGALTGDPVDVLWWNETPTRLPGPRHETTQTHGTGCAFSAAITALLARGVALRDAVKGAKAFIGRAIESAPHLGAGRGPINLHARTTQ